MKARFTRAVAHVEIALGIVIILLGVVAAIAMFRMSPPLSGPFSTSIGRVSGEELLVRMGTAGLTFGTGLVLGTLFIVAGELALVFLDIRRRMAHIDRRLRRWEEASGPPVIRPGLIV